MHILIIPSWYPSKAGDVNGSFFREQALALQNHGCKVGIIYPQLRSLKNWKSIFVGRRGHINEVDEGMPTYRYHGINWFPRLPNATAWLWVKQGINIYDHYVDQYGKPDIIHVHSALYGGCLAVEIFEKHKIPFVVTEHSTAYARGMINASQKQISKKVSAKAKHRIAVSLEFAKLLNEFHQQNNFKWQYLPNIVNKKFTNHKEKIKKDSNKFTFISIALLSEKKAIDNLITAFSKIASKSADITLKIGGDGPERAKLEQLAQDLAVSDRVFFLGSLTRDKVLEEVSNADAFVLASRYETFGVVIIEALALGKPVVATRCGGPESIVGDGDGLLVPVDDIESLSSAMWKLYRNPSDYNSEQIKRSCIERFSEETIAKSLKSIYEKVLSKK
ncbi:putative teichuronic acid biosynthesis glycosyltransferase TuaC [compost metagenome]